MSFAKSSKGIYENNVVNFTGDGEWMLVYNEVKLYEEKLMAEEGLEKTANDLIHVGKPIDFDLDLIIPLHRELVHYCEENDEENN